ncbi:MAG: aldo/keto reductase [Firmicutes bacterium]|nr:aldo/keto reductase [Bacillota bacterium]
MLYRRFGRTGLDISILGFGCMRLPTIGGAQHQIDEEKALRMLYYAIDRGLNYIDTAYPYHSAVPFQEGMSEVFLGKALQGGYREKIHLATKLPSWLIKSREDMDRYLNRQLERLQTGQIDFYLLHGLNASTWKKLKSLGVLEFLESAISDRRIRYAGFSFHDDPAAFKEIIDAYGWTFCQIQLNYMDTRYQAGEEGLKYAAERGIAVVIMEPLKGGRLASSPAVVRQVWEKAEVKRSPAEWALRFLWNYPEVSVVLSGMTEMEQVVENMRVAEQGAPNSLSPGELGLIEEARGVYEKRMRVNCTNCRYCMPCLSGVDIPEIFNHLNNAYLYEDFKGSKQVYNAFTREKASACVKCGACEEFCPQHIPIMDVLTEVVELFEK